MAGSIQIRGAREHNLKGIDVDIPRGQLTVITGVSGSGKSSLAFDTLHALGQRRYLETLSQRARQFVERLPTPAVDSVEGLTPTIALAQGTVSNQPRSTAGTLSGLWDLLRLLFARRGARRDGAPIQGHVGPWLFSFNTPRGACPACKGLGVEDRVDPELLVADPAKTLREGALVPTLPNGYIVYSQVTVDVLNDVCRAHGFDVDTPWRELTDEQRQVIFFGSDRLEVPFGKHSLESRMRWEGIKAQPREMGYYKGLVPTIEDTLQRNRNANVLRFVRTEACGACDGSRLNDDARAVEVDGRGLAEVAGWPLSRLATWVAELELPASDAPLQQHLRARLDALLALGIGHLACERAAPSLSGGETQRLRLAAITSGGSALSGVTYVFDEPSIGLHASEEQAVLDALRRLRDAGNTVVVVEHSQAALQAADHLIDLGPGAGPQGGEVLFAGPPARLQSDAAPRSITRRSFGPERAAADVPTTGLPDDRDPWLELRGATLHNLVGDPVRIPLRNLTVVCGVAGSGKSSLIDQTLARELRRRLHGATAIPGPFASLEGDETIKKVVHVDQSPIGRTPRSNPATYTGLFDRIRATFAALPEAKQQGLKSGHFSFNVKADTQGRGRCSTCEGSGRETITLHGLPDVEIACRECGGARFGPEVLAVHWEGRSIRDVLDATVDEARGWFAADQQAHRILEALHRLGLGYLTLGQPATTLSGGEAQRIKLATELARPEAKDGTTLYVLDEPTVGLHRADVDVLLEALIDLTMHGQSVLVIEHDLDVIRAAAHLIELGPGAGPDGGRVIWNDSEPLLLSRGDTPTLRALLAERDPPEPAPPPAPDAPPTIRLRGVRTHGLRDLDVDLPADRLTVVTGVSGSGKSSLVFDTLHAEARARFTEHLSAHARRQLGAGGGTRGDLDEALGLRPTIALDQQITRHDSPRSTVATLADLHAPLRILFSRAGHAADGSPTDLPAGAFSFHRREGACPDCEGLGERVRADPDKLVTAPDRPLFDGALDGTRTGKPLGDPAGKHRALVDALGAAHGFDPSRPWQDLDDAARTLILDGDPDGREYSATWRFRRGKREGEHAFTARWPGLLAEVEDEYARKRGDAAKRRSLEDDVMTARPCSSCGGSRLAPAARSVTFGGRTLPEVSTMRCGEVATWLEDVATDARGAAVLAEIRPCLLARLSTLQSLGLGHLALDRASATLSSGEHQRVRLAAHLATPLGGVVYVLDEPTLGLHPRDVRGLLTVLRGLVDAGNGVVCVEHDLEVLRAADHVVELGPGGGAAGGTIVACAAPAKLPASSRSARLLATPPTPSERSPRQPGDPLTIRGASLHDLQDVDVSFPGGCLTAVVGVSGSGKTSLVFGVLAAAARAGHPIGCRAVDGLDAFDSVVDASLGARRGSAQRTVAAAAGTWFAELRKRFAATDPARSHALKASAFDHSSKAGQCPTCRGLGRIRVELDFLGDLWSDCETCQGTRYREEVLAIRWREHTIADVLTLTVAEARALCDGEPAKLTAPLDLLLELQLGSVRLGQGTNTLSGGEAQRLHLAETLLAEKRGTRHLYLLDEPTRGLHTDDVTPLLALFDRLVDAGHTVVVVEHDAQVIGHADQVVEMGPGAGPEGGRVVRTGTTRVHRD